MALFSATLPPALLQTIKENVRIAPDAITIKLSTNRPNIIYAVQPLVGSADNLSNLNFLVPQPYHPPMPLLPKGMIFIENKLSSSNVATYLNNRLPEELRITKPFRHFHSDMSQQYLDETFQDFQSPDGACRYLVATSGAATVSFYSGRG
jgi:superfamily II DNA/RNA helicase